MPTTVAPIEATIEIAAPPARVWQLVSDLTQMRRWSPQNFRTVVLGGPTRAGARFANVNRRGFAFWPTWGTVVAFEPEKRVAFRIDSNRSVWSFDLTPNADGGTTVVQRRETPDGVAPVASALTNVMAGGSDCFSEELLRGMERTLAAIKVDAES
jgi:uncharacterized protein YndB with AHSA1/START domain